jgi:hypothetical protein
LLFSSFSLISSEKSASWQNAKREFVQNLRLLYWNPDDSATAPIKDNKFAVGFNPRFRDFPTASAHLYHAQETPHAAQANVRLR